MLGRRAATDCRGLGRRRQSTKAICACMSVVEVPRVLPEVTTGSLGLCRLSGRAEPAHAKERPLLAESGRSDPFGGFRAPE